MSTASGRSAKFLPDIAPPHSIHQRSGRKVARVMNLVWDRALLALRVGRGYDLELFVGEIVCPLL